MKSFAPHDLHEEGVGCVGCHMPVTTYMRRHPRHDHGFRIPDPITGQALGIPDACSRCHPERDNVAAFVAAYGAHEVDRRARAFVEGDTEALLAILEDPEQPPIWRASAAARAGADPMAVPRLKQQLLAQDGLVRFGAWAGFGPWLEGEADAAGRLQAGLRDPVRAVQVAAARAGAARLAWDAPEAEPYRTYLEHNADQPDALVEDASWALARGDADRAYDRLQQALGIDPQHVASLDGLAVLLAGAGRPGDAANALERAVALAPGEGELWARLGLARAQAGDTTGAEVALLEAVGRGAPRAHYNLGLVLAQRGAHAEALQHLFAAEEIQDGPDVRYAIASTLWQWGRHDEARIAAKRVLQLDPEHPGARQVLAAPPP
jgi:tetratricopeptide (TPR) repeat protein